MTLPARLSSCMCVDGVVQVPVELAREIVEALRDAGEFVAVPYLTKTYPL